MISKMKTEKGAGETIQRNTEENYKEKQMKLGTGNQNLKLISVTNLLSRTGQHTSSSFWVSFLSDKLTKSLFLPISESGCNDQVK